MRITPLRLALAAAAVTAPMVGTATGPAQAADAAGPPVPALLAALDANKDGRLTLEELDADREQQLARFDRDGDGRLSAEEYQAYWLDAARERLARQFRADDRNHDGSVSVDELKQRAAELVRRRDARQGRRAHGRRAALRAAGRRRRAELRRAAPQAGRAAGVSVTSQAAGRAVVQHDVAAVAAHDRAGDRQAQADAAGLGRARLLQPHERLEHALEHVLRDAGAVVVDARSARSSRPAAQADPRALPVADGVLDQVAQRPAQRQRPAGVGQPPALGEARRRRRDRPDPATVLSISAARSTTRVGSLVASSRAKASVALDHRCISSSVASIRVPGLLVVDELRPQAQRGDRRAQVVADRRQHPRAVVDEPAQPGLHPVERRAPCAGCRPGRPRLERRRRLAPAERLGRGGEPGQRPGEAADGEHDAERRPGCRIAPAMTRLGSAQPGGGGAIVSAFSQRPSASWTASCSVTGRVVAAGARGRPASRRRRGSKPIRLAIRAARRRSRPAPAGRHCRRAAPASWRASRLRAGQPSCASTALGGRPGESARGRRCSRPGCARCSVGGRLLEQPHQARGARQDLLAARRPAAPTRRSSAKIRRLSALAGEQRHQHDQHQLARRGCAARAVSRLRSRRRRSCSRRPNAS